MRYAIFIDIDGTLVSDRGIISNRCKNIVRNIVSIGHIVVLCTARPRYHAQLISEEIGASNYVLSSNGAELYDYLNKKVLFSNPISANTTISVLKKVIDKQLRATVAINDIEYIIGRKYNRYQLGFPEQYEKFIKNNDIKQFMIVDDTDYKLDEMRAYVESFDDVAITNKHTIKEEQGNWFSFVEKNTSKGNGILKFSKLFSIPKENIISIGNDYNDISMFIESGTSVAVSNADNDILSLADEITDSNNNDGVAKILEKFYINKL